MRGVVVALALFILGSWGQVNQITSLPGISNSAWKFNQYSGYVNVHPQTGRNLFYWFVESQSSPATDPVALWLTGGPGCSSLSALFEENGPFYPTLDSNGNVTLAVNPYSWNTVANVIYLESPSGVGFSYSTNTSDYTVGDARTANDTYTFLLNFFQMFPQFAKNPFWITGESYGGHYVPTLAQRVVQGNSENPNQYINFQGFMVGNAWTDAPIDNYGAVFQWWSHALISDQTFNGIVSTCEFQSIGPLANQDQCDDWLNQSNQEMGDISIYDMYADVCLSDNSGMQLLNYLANSDSKFASFARTRLDKNFKRGTPEQAPCIDNYLTNYLNQPAVKQAIHALPDANWTICADIDYSYEDLLTSVLPVYQFLLQQNLNLNVYSGDVDAIVPTPGTRLWLNALNLTIADAWRPWLDSNQQVGGYTVGYEGLTFFTVRGAGHMVPGTQPVRALDFFERILSGIPL